MKLEYSFQEVRPRIFFLNFKDSYQCAMTFLRYQEYYESTNAKFRGNSFELLEFMDWYVEHHKYRAFLYPIDWGGFNVPSRVFTELYQKGIPDENHYDREIRKVYDYCLKKYPDGKFYVIGAAGKGVLLKHEVAHGLFYTTPEYKKEMTQLIKKVKPTIKKKAFAWFKKVGYAKSVYKDELQAYLATGFPEIKASTKARAPFVAVFKKYYKK